MKAVSNNFYYFGICHFCKGNSSCLQRCSSCKTVAYCSKDHQKSDWHNHREICKVITFSIVNSEESTNRSFKEWTDHRLNIQQKWMSLLKRPLEPYESQMWMFPRVCNFCYTKTNLTDCALCYNAAYCSNEHQEIDQIHHKKYCNALKLCMNIDCYLAKYKSYPKIDVKLLTSSLAVLPQDMNQLLKLVCKSRNENQIQRALIADTLSVGATLMYAMQELLNYASKVKYVIHLVGAAAAEGTIDWMLNSELLFHAFDNISEIVYILIGPEAWEVFANFELCEACKVKGKKITFNVYKSLYHDVAINIEKPDLVVALNCGLHEFEETNCDEWHFSIPFMITNIPFVYTSYTEEELSKDLDYIKKIIPDIESYVTMEGRNPFSSLRPLRDWCTKDIPVFYSNSYITVIRKT